jgi:hypothetical protein
MPPRTNKIQKEEGAGAAAATSVVVEIPAPQIDISKGRKKKTVIETVESASESETVLAHSDSEISEVSPPKKGGRKKKTMMKTVSSDTESGVASAADTTVPPPMSVDEIKTYMFSMTEQLVAMRKNMKPNMELSEDDLYLIQSGFMKLKEEVGALDKMITNLSIRAHKKISKGHISELKSATSSSRKPKKEVSEEEIQQRKANASVNKMKTVVPEIAQFIREHDGEDTLERELEDDDFSSAEIQKFIRHLIHENKDEYIVKNEDGTDMSGKPFYTTRGQLGEFLELLRVQIVARGVREKVEIRERQKLRRVRGSNEQIQESVVSGLIHEDGTFPEHFYNTSIMALTPFAFVPS